MPTKASAAAEKIKALLHPTLEESYDPQAMIALVPIHNDQKVADIGSGPGWLSIPLAKYLYSGTCYAVDIKKDMLEHVKTQGDIARLGNIETVVSKENKIPLDDASLDGVVLSNVLNEAKSPKALIKEGARLIKKAGWLCIVEWQPSDGKSDIGPDSSKRLVQEEMRKVVEDLGLTTLTSRQLSYHRYIIVARK